MSKKEGDVLSDDLDEGCEDKSMVNDSASAIKNYVYHIESFTPAEIVKSLDRFIIGQDDAKRAVAVALRNRWRRSMVPQPLREDIIPKNILMIGPTGVGKTEVARRLAKLLNVPFIKVEATKFTEIGYVGRDVDSIVRDLVEIAIEMVRNDMRSSVESKAKLMAKDRILDALVGEGAQYEATRASFAKKLDAGKLDDSEVSISVKEASAASAPMFDMPGHGGQIGIMNMSDVIGKLFSGNKKTRTMKIKVKDAWGFLINDEMEKMLDEDQVVKDALDLVSNNGLVFLDEIDKIADSASTFGKGEVSRKGVQRDLLPLLEGTTVATKYGNVKTDHILFIASGAFHSVKPSDLLPELQGRLPIRVELKALGKEAMVSILKDTESSLLKQYSALLATENVKLEFTDDGIEAIAEIAIDLNDEIENIGARRLHTILEKLLEDISFTASDKPESSFAINEKYVKKALNDVLKKLDLAKFIL